jgi:insulysin
VSSLAGDLHIYSMENILSANYYLTKFDSELIESLYSYLIPEKMRVSVISKKYESRTNLTEKWYGTEYKIEKLTHQLINELKTCQLNDAFHLPPKNTFIPKDFNLVNHQNNEFFKFPNIIYSSVLSRLWFKEDTKFLLPKAVIKFELRNPLIYTDPVNVNMANLFVELLCDSLTEYTYSAELAGLKYNIKPTNYGLNIGLSGFSDKMDILLETLFERMTTFRIDQQRFNILKESVSFFLNFL